MVLRKRITARVRTARWCLTSSAKSASLPAQAQVAELVDALDLGSSGATREGSIPSLGTSV